MKLVTIEAEFPELLSGRMWQNARASGTTVPTAVRRALAEILKREGIRRRRLSVIKLRISISNGGAP